jgi:hypothetical protein
MFESQTFFFSFFFLRLLRIRPSGLFHFRINLCLCVFFRHLVGFLGRGIAHHKTSFSIYKTARSTEESRTYVHASNGIRTQDSSVRAVEDSTRRRQRGHCYRQPAMFFFVIFSVSSCSYKLNMCG